MANQNKLKAYVRYDGTGRVIAGGPILQRFKPKVGNWVEIDASECCNTTTTTTTASPTTTTTTTSILLDINLLSDGSPLCGGPKVWVTEAPAQVKCDWLELTSTPGNSYGGSTFKYYSSAGINVGTQLYNTTPGNPPVTFSGTYVYYPSGPVTSAQIIVVTTGVISAIYNLSDLPACPDPYVCPTTTTTTTSIVTVSASFSTGQCTGNFMTSPITYPPGVTNFCDATTITSDAFYMAPNPVWVSVGGFTAQYSVSGNVGTMLAPCVSCG